jgi:hypothetical protein
MPETSKLKSGAERNCPVPSAARPQASSVFSPPAITWNDWIWSDAETGMPPLDSAGLGHAMAAPPMHINPNAETNAYFAGTYFMVVGPFLPLCCGPRDSVMRHHAQLS